jgi:hypothetical protein
VTSVCFSPDGERLATGSLDHTARVWEARTGQPLFTLQGHSLGVYSVSFSPDGTRLATGSADKTARLWDVRTAQEIHTLQGHARAVIGVAFSPDGQRLTGRDDAGKVLLWDVATGKPVNEPPPQQLVPSSPRSPDGQRFAHIDGATVRLLGPPDSEELLGRRARTRLDPTWHAAEAVRREQEQQWLAAAFHLEQVLTVFPDAAAVRNHLPATLAEALRSQPDQASTWRRLALAQLYAGQEDAFRPTCRDMQQRFRVPGPLPQAAFAVGALPSNPPGAVVTAALLRHPAAPAGAGDFDRLEAVRAAVLRPDTLTEPESWLPLLPGEEKLLRGAVLCRAGKHAEAVTELAGLQQPVALLFRALAEYGRGNPDAARQALAEARQVLPPARSDLVEQTPLPWQQRVEGDLLVKEVELLLAAPRK